ncbi:hypothetical protein THRCLA_22657 [Thraustotheca clavata]|uniref:Dynein axonemal light chain 1 n=1 Tax=Thraustotheca clavata TaxID=74557 RepID=A0A1V9YV04_9STRA|nr:hypothetical protein THRCLA_22657 [Thraustotheca clavata]
MQKKPKLVPQSCLCGLLPKKYGRQLTRETCERALGGFDGVPSIDMSRNQFRITPHNFCVNLIALNLSFNCIEDIRGLKTLTQLQSLDLSYNRLYQVDVLLHCTSLIELQLQGNRLSSSKGIESLKELKRLNMSDNLIETPDAIRGLSLNVSLQSLSLEGNPISLIKEYRVLVLDLVHFEEEEEEDETKAPPHYIAPNIPPKSYAELKAEDKLKQTSLKQKLQPKKDQPEPNCAYVSLFNRLAVANGVNVREETARPQTPVASKSKSRVSSKTILATKRKIFIVLIFLCAFVLTLVPTVHPRRQLHFNENASKPAGDGAEPTTLNPSQMKVLDVIQGLIQHKRQTIAALNSSLA